LTTTAQFANIPMKYREYNQSKIIILPIPYGNDAEASAPQAILDASNALFLYDHETDSEVFQHGICTLPPFSAWNPQWTW
jgi:agmatinase